MAKKKSASKKTKAKSTKEKKPKSIPLVKKVHPWRLCPEGWHWVVDHPLTIPATKKRSSYKTVRDAHCARNPSGKDQLYFDEIEEIQNQNFRTLPPGPTPEAMEYDNGNNYDLLIRGWVDYWNAVFQPSISLEYDAVKALIASESGFRPTIKTHLPKPQKGFARGLMQVTDPTAKILGNESGELTNHYLTLTHEQMLDPNANICAGVRWLYRKRELAEWRLGRSVTWEEVVAEYKGTLRKATPTSYLKHRDMQPFLERYEWIKTGKEPFTSLKRKTKFKKKEKKK